MKRLCKFAIVLMLLIAPVFSVSSQDNTYVDDEGIIRWELSGEEVTGFGVNYSAPFAHAYRSAEKLGLVHIQFTSRVICVLF